MYNACECAGACTCMQFNAVGFCSNGEYNSLRNQGYTRPLSILRIRSDIRSRYARMSKQAMLAMLTPKG